MTLEDLQKYSDAWNAHDINAVMEYMTDDCVFETGGGTDKHGTRYEGYENVKARFVEVWTDMPDVQFNDAKHFIQADRGCSQWTFIASKSDGSTLEVNGVDLFTFVGDKIQVKDSYLKFRKG
jgi:hypothetical protein